MNIIRWIIFFPVSVGLAIIASILGNLLGMFTAWITGYDQTSFFNQLWSTSAGGIFMGFAVIWAGVKIVPSHKKAVAYVLGILAISYSGAAMYYALLLESYWGLWSLILVIITVGIVLFNITEHFPEIDEENQDQ